MRRWLRWTAAAAVALGALGGCSLRDRSNPLDPKNQSPTHGRLTGFNALAGDGVVLLRWSALAQSGVESWRVDRWAPGDPPAPLPGALYPPHATSAEDLTARNDSTYVYRLVARFVSGDSLASPPDTVTPGTRRTLVLVATLPGVVGLSPDGRDILFANESSESYGDVDLDPTRGVFWLSQYERGLVTSRLFETVGSVEFEVTHPVDLAITTQRGGVLWVAQPDFFRVTRFGSTDTLGGVITGLGPARAVESNSANSTLWIGSDDGRLFHASASTVDTLESWLLPGRVNPVAVDEAADVAWIAVRSSEFFDVYRVEAGNPTPQLIRSGLISVTDLEVEPLTRTVWISERGAPLGGSGRLTRLGPAGEVLAIVTGLEPYALSVEPGSSGCWVTDIKSDRLIQVAPDGGILRRSPPLGVPYGVRVYRP